MAQPDDSVLEELPVCPGGICKGCASWDCVFYEALSPVYFSSDATEISFTDRKGT